MPPTRPPQKTGPSRTGSTAQSARPVSRFRSSNRIASATIAGSDLGGKANLAFMSDQAAIYARTSGIDSKSVREQVDICRRRAQERSWHVRYILSDEGMSGGDPSRPGYNALWDHIQEQRIDVLVTWKIDRIARSLAEMSALEE